MELDLITSSNGIIHIVIYGSMYKVIFAKALNPDGPELTELHAQFPTLTTERLALIWAAQQPWKES